MTAIELNDVSKSFGFGATRIHALEALSLSIPSQGVYGLLGPNGAGKSTLLRMICGLVRPDRGGISLFGEPAGPPTRARLGALIDAPTFYPFMTAREFLAMLASVSGVRADVPALLRRVDLTRAADQKVSGFSLGMRQRLGIAAALVARPAAVILDEPTNGLDPDGMIEIRHLIRRLAQEEGLAVLLSSHLLDEVEKVADRVAILNRGRLVAEGKVGDLLGGEERLWLDVAQQEPVLEKLGEVAWVEGKGVAVRIARAEVPRLLSSLLSENISVYEAKWIRPDLETFFLAETRDSKA
ncbi:ABC transporter ATP-binding protein [Rhizobium oryzicola]|uniref:ABC transporter ATP-binding protein n=1 Tax=Rhizobium oryzicola TaxID=1232668 RepID=A0ABT8T4C7_9HYPH|nr:ABC transporter ATP-binding protein [Rhizobium oryzicola]MDO1585614.1 ABC transporter ATP-binding protein [Rhizobium oryzicola]